MKKFNNLFLKTKQVIDNKDYLETCTDQYVEIGRLVKEARIQKNISIEELSRLTKIPEYIINSIENNIEKNRPKYPFIRSILLKLEKCLLLKENKLIGLLSKESKNPRKHKKNFVLRKFDFINTWEGTILYFLIMILAVFLLKKYFFSNINIIEIKSFEEIKKEN